MKRLLVPAAVFIVAFAVRWATLDQLTGDDHYTLWEATSFLQGDRPFRDFVDLGDPLYWIVSTIAQALAGYRVIGEVLLGVTLEAIALTITFHLAWRATGSRATAALLTVLALLVVRRELYAYPKVFLYPLGLWLCWRYIDRPTRAWAIALAAGVAVAFGYRHDHGTYIGVGAAAAMLAAHWPEGMRGVLTAWLQFGVALLILLLPFLGLVQAHEGVVSYFRERIRLAHEIDAGSRRPVAFRVDAEAPPHWFRIDAPPPARVVVEWKPELDPDVQRALEAKYSLTNRQENSRVGTRTKWEYALTNVSRDNIRAIVEDPHVSDTGLIARDTYTPMEESFYIRAQRALPPLRASIAPQYWHPFNAGLVLHYVARALPFVAFLMLGVDWIRGRRRGRMANAPQKLFATAVLMAVVAFALVRREGYFSDHAVAFTVLGAVVIGHTAQRVPRMVAGVVIAACLFAGSMYVNVAGSLTRMEKGLPGLWTENVRAFQTYSTSPPIDAYAPKGVAGDRALIRYVYECTRPDDRVWILSDLFTFPYYAERRVVGHIYWRAGLRADEAFQRSTVARVEASQVPMIIGQGGAGPLSYLQAYPIVREYVARRYTNHYAIPQEGSRSDGVFWLLTDSRRTPTSTYQPLLNLPCFR